MVRLIESGGVETSSSERMGKPKLVAMGKGGRVSETRRKVTKMRTKKAMMKGNLRSLRMAGSMDIAMIECNWRWEGGRQRLAGEKANFTLGMKDSTENDE